MAETWPASLPCRFLHGTQTRKLGDNLLRSQTETGPGKQRPRASSAAAPLTGLQRMTGAQVQTLIAFYRLTLREGALPFSIPVRGEEVAQLVRFTDQPDWTDVSPDKYDVTLSLEILP